MHIDQTKFTGQAAARAPVPVYEWLSADGFPMGCGTQVEFDHWAAEGVNAPGEKLGKILCYEPASMDERRKAAWAREARS